MIINSIQGGGREVLGSHAALRWGGRDLQSALNRAVSCLCDCQVGHYWLIRVLFFLPCVALIGLNRLLPPVRCPNAIRPFFHRNCHFHRCDFHPSAPTPPNPLPPQSLPSFSNTPHRPSHSTSAHLQQGERVTPKKLSVSIEYCPNSSWFQWNKRIGAAPHKKQTCVEVAKIRRGPLKFTGVKRSSLLSDSATFSNGNAPFPTQQNRFQRRNADIPPMFLQHLLRNFASSLQTDATILVFLISWSGCNTYMYDYFCWQGNRYLIFITNCGITWLFSVVDT